MVKGLLKIGLPAAMFIIGCVLVILQSYPLGIVLIFFSGCLCVLLAFQSFDVLFAKRSKMASLSRGADGQTAERSGFPENTSESQSKLEELQVPQGNDTPNNLVERSRPGTSEFRLDEEGWLVHEKPAGQHSQQHRKSKTQEPEES